MRAFAQAEEEYNRNKSELQDRLYQDVLERQRRSSKAEDVNAMRAMTRRYRATRGESAAAAGGKSKRDLIIKGSTYAVPLRQGEVEEDFEA